MGYQCAKKRPKYLDCTKAQRWWKPMLQDLDMTMVEAGAWSMAQ